MIGVIALIGATMTGCTNTFAAFPTGVMIDDSASVMGSTGGGGTAVDAGASAALAAKGTVTKMTAAKKVDLERIFGSSGLH